MTRLEIKPVNNLRKRNWRGLVGLGLLALVLAGAALAEWRYIGPLPFVFGANPNATAPLARWPWREAAFDRPLPGVTHWFDRSSPDGTQVDLFDFDFAANPHLRFGLYDQDEDDVLPFDGKARPWAMDAAQAAEHLNRIGRGTVIAACNGLFYDYDRTGPNGAAFPVTPLVLNGTVHYTGLANHRWTFGVKYGNDGRPTFREAHLPDTAAIRRDFTYAAGGAQCLVLNGQAQAFPLEAAGNSNHPAFAFMKTSRVSWGWSRDSRHLYLLFIKEPGEEAVSEWAWEHHLALGGGWSLPDEAHFWSALGVWDAINSDAGDVAQLVYRLPDGQYEITRRYEMSEPRWSSSSVRRPLPADLSGAPAGGSLLYWYVSDVKP